MNITVFLVGSVLAALFLLANYLWFSGVEKEDVSRFVPVMSFDIAFISVLSFIFLGQSFSLPVYLGMSLTIVGCILISLEDPLNSVSKFKSRWALLAALGSALTYSVREVFFQSFTTGLDIWTVLFYYGFAGSTISTLILYSLRGELTGNIKSLEHMTLSGLISGGSQVFFFLAVSLGAASLVSTLTKTRFFIIFLTATLISKLHPEIIHESLDKSVLLQKLIATALIVTGVTTATLM